jgi:hypothetical protein
LPATAGPFVQGTWTGAFKIQQAVTNVFLRAVDQEGHAGIGNVFAVESTGIQALNPSRITSIQLEGAGIAISLTSVAGQHYVLETTDSLLSGTWTSVQSPIAGTGSILRIIDSNPARIGSSFYRIRLVP